MPSSSLNFVIVTTSRFPGLAWRSVPHSTREDRLEERTHQTELEAELVAHLPSARGMETNFTL